MLRRNTEKVHKYSEDLFNHYKIYDLQGLLREDDTYQCGIESYSVENKENIDFSFLNTKREELARFRFCQLLSIPYYIIVTINSTKSFYLYEIKLEGPLKNELQESLLKKMDKDELVAWWRSKQSFTQIKPMYDAEKRLETSLLDKILFANNLAWGINIDGFYLDKNGQEIKFLVEKRVITYSDRYSVKNYDPNRFFHGTQNRFGDFSSWDILFKISKALNCNLLLMTFDTNEEVNKMGIAKVVEVCKSSGLIYEREIKIFEGTSNEQKKYIKKLL